eukprot:1184566-Prorocentrum_minimum.AAC.6
MRKLSSALRIALLKHYEYGFSANSKYVELCELCDNRKAHTLGYQGCSNCNRARAYVLWLDTEGKPINAHGGGIFYSKTTAKCSYLKLLT